MHRRITGQLVIATHNPGKLAEMRELLAPHGVEAVSAGELGLAEPEETGKTFHANARIKAITAAQAAGLAAFADDSGLVVDARDGAPGIYSARWGGPNKDFNEAMARIERLLRERGATSPEKRTAHFVSALCVAWPDDHLEEVEARADGEARIGLVTAFGIASLLTDALAVRSEADGERGFDRLPLFRRQAFAELEALNAALKDALDLPGAGARLAARKAADRAAVFVA